jgi:hypothetical protein
MHVLEIIVELNEVDMSDADRKKRIREDLAELKSAALAKLEQLGYDVRGKTPRQIRQLLRRRPSKQNLKVADRN